MSNRDWLLIFVYLYIIGVYCQQVYRSPFLCFFLEVSDYFLIFADKSQITQIMSPVFRRESEYTFKIYSNEEERMHIHVLCDGKEAKYWLEPQVELAKNTGIPEHKLNEIKIIVEKYADNFKEQFRQHIGKRIDD